MTAEHRYDAVFFDLYGTLVDIRTDESSDGAWSALRAALADDHGITYPDDAALRRRFETLFDPVRAAATAARGEWAEPDLLPVYRGLLRGSAAVGETGGTGAAAGSGEFAADADVRARRLAWTFRRASTSLLCLYPGAARLLAELRTAGLRVVLVSNAQSCYTRPELDLLGLSDVFDRIVISSEEGVRKPSPEIFRRALEREGLRPERVVMVGNDTVADIAGARAAGIDGVYLRTAVSPQDDPDVCGDAACSLTGPDYAGVMRYLESTESPDSLDSPDSPER